MELQPEHQLSVSALLELDSGERVVLLDDRGRTSSAARRSSPGCPHRQSPDRGHDGATG
ncbi:MAG: hypothetical protein PGN11_00270 [Quadrisphaera sp.]